MALGIKSMSLGMKTAWTIARFTGFSVFFISAIELKLIGLIIGGEKK
jgi:hypothetical protein